MKGFLIAPLLLLFAVASPAAANPLAYQLPDETVDFQPGPGVETAVVCETCHSADYIRTQPPDKGKAFWRAEVEKMINVFKAPINESDAAVIVDYLAATY